jgi:hypothetical protein
MYTVYIPKLLRPEEGTESDVQRYPQLTAQKSKQPGCQLQVDTTGLAAWRYGG